MLKKKKKIWVFSVALNELSSCPPVKAETAAMPSGVG